MNTPTTMPENSAPIVELPADPVEHLYHMAAAMNKLSDCWNEASGGIGCIMGMFAREIYACAKQLDG